jgi:molecular chaperone DnaK
MQAAFHKVSEAMYERAQQQQQAGAPNGASADGAEAGGSEDEDVVDAEVVDEGKS